MGFVDVGGWVPPGNRYPGPEGSHMTVPGRNRPAEDRLPSNQDFRVTPNQPTSNAVSSINELIHFRPTKSSRTMTPIRRQDTVFLTIDYDNCVNELRANHATFQAPLHVTIPPGKRFGGPRIRAHDLIVEFDETRTTRAAVVSVLAKYGCQERPQGRDTSFWWPGGPRIRSPSS